MLFYPRRRQRSDGAGQLRRPPLPWRRRALCVSVVDAGPVGERLQLRHVLHQDAADFEDALRVAVDRHVVSGDDDLRRGAVELGARQRDDAVPFAGEPHRHLVRHPFARRLADDVVVLHPRPGGRFEYATPETVVGEGDLIVVAAAIDKAQAFAALE